MTEKDQEKSKSSKEDYYKSLDTISKKIQLRYYLLSYIQAIIVMLVSSSSFITSLLVATNRSACLYYPLNINITIRQFFIIDIVIEGIWFFAHVYIVVRFISKQNKGIQKFSKIMSIFNTFFFIFRFAWQLVITIQTIGTNKLQKCDSHALALINFLEYTWFLGIFIGIINLIYCFCHKTWMKDLERQLTSLETNKTKNRYVQILYGKALMSQGRKNKVT